MTAKRSLQRIAGGLLGVALALVSASRASASPLVDGTAIQVRMLGYVDSESGRPGDALSFVVLKDITVDGYVVIARGAKVTGVVVKARRAHWGFRNHDAKLAFRFNPLVASNGQVIRLRGTLEPEPKERVNVQNSHHDRAIEWAGGGDTFSAYVDGEYAF